MSDKFNAKDALADYVTVPQRIAQFYELFGQGRLVTGEVRTEMGPDGKPRVIVSAAAYRTPDDPLPGIGWSWMELPGTTSFTRGSELENTETSAWGRAIAALGILVDRSVASANEVATKKGDKPEARESVKSGEPEYVGPWAGTGKVIIRKTGPADGNIRNSPEFQFMRFAFSTTEDELIPQVEVRGSLIHAILDAEGGPLDGLVATISGDLYRVSFLPAGSSRPQTFQRLVLSHIKTAAWELPVPIAPGQVGAFDAEAELDALL